MAHPVRDAGLALSLLFMTVLAFDNYSRGKQSKIAVDACEKCQLYRFMNCNYGRENCHPDRFIKSSRAYWVKYIVYSVQSGF